MHCGSEPAKSEASRTAASAVGARRSRGTRFALAGVLRFLEWAMTYDAPGPEPKTIEIEHIEAAASMVEKFFLPHAMAALGLVGGRADDVNTRRVLRWLRDAVIAGRSTCSREDIRVDALARKFNADGTTAILERLERAGWVRKVVAPVGPGKPPARWEINPAIGAVNNC